MEIREDGTIDPLMETTVMGGSMGQLGPFSEAIDFPAPTAGAIVLMTLSPENGQVWEASVPRVAFSTDEP